MTTGKKLLDDREFVTPAKKGEEEKEELTRTEKIKKEEEERKKKKEKSMKAWGDTGEKTEFGFWGFSKFTFPRLWTGGICVKLLCIFNMILVISVKVFAVIVPIVLKYAVEAIICDPDSLKGEEVCPTATETYLLIGLYGGIKFLGDFINYMREIPFAYMSARAEISIAHDVYDHVTRLSLAFHLSRETGKVVRIVSKGSQSFATVLRLGSFNLMPICLEIVLTLVVFVTLFAWQFSVLQLCLVFLYIAVTYFMTERRAGSFSKMTKAD